MAEGGREDAETDDTVVCFGGRSRRCPGRSSGRKCSLDVDRDDHHRRRLVLRGLGRVEGVGTVSGVGRVSFRADWLSGCDEDHGPFSSDPICFTDEEVVLTKKNGATLWLRGGLTGGQEAFDFGGLVVPWNVAGGTGRFASASGSGTVSFTPRLVNLVGPPSPTASITLTGTLER